MAKFDSLQLKDYAPDLFEIFSECSCHGSLFKSSNKLFTSQTLQPNSAWFKFGNGSEFVLYSRVKSMYTPQFFSYNCHFDVCNLVTRAQSAFCEETLVSIHQIDVTSSYPSFFFFLVLRLAFSQGYMIRVSYRIRVIIIWRELLDTKLCTLVG